MSKTELLALADALKTDRSVSHRPFLDACDKAAAALREFAGTLGQEPVAWHVCSVNSDGSLSLEFAAPWEELAHEHINDAINEHDIDGATSWVVRPVYTHPPAPQRKPLSDEQIWAIYRSSALTGKEGVLLNFARAVLAAAQEQKP